MKIVAVSGSIRKDSYNTGLLKFMKDRYGDKMDIEILNIAELPFYSQDIEKESFDSVTELRDKVRDADGIIFATPEHNSTIPVALKNFIDWMSRVDPVLIGKPAMILGASPGRMGTVNAQGHLRDILNAQFVEVKVLPANYIFIGGVHEQVDENNILNDEGTIKFIDSVVDNFIDWVNLFK